MKNLALHPGPDRHARGLGRAALAALLFLAFAAARAAADDAALVTRRYDVLPSIESYFTPDSGNPGDPFVFRVCGQGDNGAGVEDALRDYAAERGVTWPEGSGVEYLPASGCVEMRNTEANHALFRDVVARFAAFQIRVRAQFVSVAPDAVAALGLEDVLGGSLAPEEWSALRARLAAHPGAELRGCVSTIAQTGVQTTGKGVVEAIYPTEFDVRLLRAAAGAPVAAVEPRNYLTREVGEIVTVTPRIYAGGLRISLDLTPWAVLPPVWREFAPAGFGGSIVQPHFPVFFTLASLDLIEGRTVALGGATVDEPGRGPRCELLFLTAELVGLDGRRVPFAPRTAGAAPGLVSRRLPVLPSHLEYFAAAAGSAPVGDDAAGADGETPPAPRDEYERALRAIADRGGVGWPAGSGFWYEPKTGSLEIRNTPENVERFRAALARDRVLPVQIRIRTRFAAATPEAFEALGLADRLGAQLPPDERDALFARLDAEPGVETLARPSILATSGTQNAVKGVTECIYPTEYRNRTLDATRPAGAPTNEPPAALGVVAEPRNFQMREVGQILQVTPRLSSDGSRISLDLTPTLVYPPEWKDFAAPPPDAGAAGAAAPFIGKMEQPFFPVFSVATSLDLKSGSTAVLGGTLLDVPGKGPRHQLFFLTAETVDLEGNPVP